ncbi:type III secretion system (T3SS) SseB-like protein [Homoserinimonas aerilata]|uniref:Type III secretion system (T3SS) SseB-like protein n=1 Tax=Homoserinimonas aerilata TaxID=1162970 RepID=A0A542YJW7_9MICO|nr:SseB family protein [Homoserinimonas aerilata]TQL48351.1 type III secretion system (T3SS) SseB-like protein [Homoserinimonas aerilata]
MHDGDSKHDGVPVSTRLADSAGRPWAGRHFEEVDPAVAEDDGSAPEGLSSALDRFRAGQTDAVEVVDALRECRLLVPLVAQLGESGVNEHGVVVDKSAELSIVTVAGPDGRNVMPVFGSVEAMQRWNPMARPVPVDAVRVALAAADEGTDLVVLDPTSPSEFVVRRPALWAIAQSLPWVPSHSDPEVVAEFEASIASEPLVAQLVLSQGDPDARLLGPELVVTLTLAPGLDQATLDALLARVQQRWASSTTIAERVDSLAVKLRPTPAG